LRHTNPALLEGNYIALNENDPNVLAYLRKSNHAAVIVVINMSASPRNLDFDLSSQGLNASAARTLMTTQSSLKSTSSVQHLQLDPFAVCIAEVKNK
jgi:glycosidase